MAEEPRISKKAPRLASDRRRHPRYAFAADAEVVEARSGARIEARIVDISELGCHVATGHPFPLGTAIKVGISKGPDRFVTEARIVSSSAKGMGLAFSKLTQGQVQALEAWLGPLRERDLLALNRRRTQRVLMQVRIKVSGDNTRAKPFDEQTHTLAVNAHGASILLLASVKTGQWLKLLNEATGDAAECIVAYVGPRQADRMEVGISFVLPNPTFWHVAFPPDGWIPPDAEGL
jgi:hypothetical protein